MGMIGPGEARDCQDLSARVPDAKQFGDPSRRWDTLEMKTSL